MKESEIAELATMLRYYGTAPVVQSIFQILDKEKENYGEGAIIHHNVLIVKECAECLDNTRTKRLKKALSLMPSDLD